MRRVRTSAVAAGCASAQRFPGTRRPRGVDGNTRYKADCYMKQTAYALYVRNDDLAAVFALCRETAEQEFRPVCYQGHWR